MRNIEVLHDYILLQRKPPSELTRGGLLIPEQAARVSFEFKVLAVGPDVTIPIKEDNYVIIDVPNAKITMIDDIEVVYIRQEHVVAVL
jgi:co-chaperonin GroES (HSP10)